MPLPKRIQDLSPKWAHFYLEVEGFVFNELGLDLSNKKLLIALSGGLDSTALLVFGNILQRRWNCKVLAAHLNHKLRTQSDMEEQENQSLCEQLNLSLYIGRSNVKVYSQRLNTGIEEAARKIRYGFLSALCKKYQCDFLLIAHHLNDLAEDFILRQLRGTGWPSLAGMKAYESNSRVLRPFLLFPKQTLQRFVESMDLSWQEDLSNRDLSFKRNRIRREILPLFYRENPNFLNQIKQLWKQANLDQDYWEELMKISRDREYKDAESVFIPLKELANTHSALRLRWYRNILNRLGPGQALSPNLLQLDSAWKKGSGGKIIQFPGNKRAKIIKKGIRFYLEKE